MNKHKRTSRKRSADHLESHHIVKKTKYTFSGHRTTSKHQSGSYWHISHAGYRQRSILPDVIELNQKPRISPHVKPHIVNGSYNNWQHYLNTQFTLLREDFVAPLRKGIFDYKKNEKASDINVYKQAAFTEMVLNENGILLTVEFETPNNNRLNQNLINGKLLCFSHDNFETIIFAIVINQNNRSQNNQVRVKIVSENDELNILGLNNCTSEYYCQEYTMIEAPAHYETYCHFLTSLQHANPQKMPFTNYLIDFNYRKIQHPNYLTRNTIFSMAKVLGIKKDNSHPSCFDITSDDEWPSHKITELNKSQLAALQYALTHEIALIQGPPGTGKTFIGKKIMEALLINKTKWDRQGVSPILVVCYTNQALDQFLEKIIELDIIKDMKCSGNHSHKIARIGGGCKSEKVKEYLKEMQEVDKKNGKRPFSGNYFKLKRELKKLSKDVKKQMELLISNNPPSFRDLSQFIPPVHSVQLRKLNAVNDNCIDVWLKDCERHVHYNQQNSCVRSLANQSSSNSLLKKVHCNVLHGNQEDKEDFAIIEMRNCNIEQQAAYTTAEAESIDDINILSLRERKNLYHYWIRLYRDKLYNEVCNLIDKFNETHAEFMKVQNIKDVRSLQNALVIGMTATGVAKHRHLLEELNLKIVIVEEAAEMMESHIIPCLSAATKHLILIGDHKQLQPKSQDYQLGSNYKLNVSLFERLIKNGIPHKTLTVQYRMRPEIARLIFPHIYPTLENHEKVTEYGSIRGIKTNMYFFNHKYQEQRNYNSHSYYNAREADLVAGLCNYLLKQDYEPNKITVLAAYISQVNELLKLIPDADSTAYAQDSNMEADENEQHVKITTIDNYQGEENDIVILSLVRSNCFDKLGFLQFENRVCVALSRARKGLYCFGNFDLLCKSNKSDVWQRILGDVKNKNQLGSVLQLCCSNHPESITTITQPKDFQKVPEGGCSLQCNAPLGCGHRCSLKCHIKDIHHNQYVCKEACLKQCKHCGEPCKLKCSMGCQKCEALIEKTIPGCNHTQHIPCYMEPEEFNCKEKCNRICSRGHPCTSTCSEVCKCLDKKTKNLECGHQVTLFCFENYAIPDCTAPCNKTCSTNIGNPHKCLKRCSDICGNCDVMVEVALPRCGHKQQVPCYMQHKLNLFADIISCTKMITVKFPTCEHIAVIPCGKDILDYSCCKPVIIKLPCGHNKEMECCKTQSMNKEDISEECYVKVTKIFRACNHVVDLACHDSHLTECPVKCNTVLLCGHKCSGTCHECHQGRLHKPCMFHISKLLCGHDTTMRCSSAMIKPYPSCSYRCEQFCSHKKCSHKCQDSCKPCHKPCDWQCSHYKCTKRCYEKCNRPRCYEPCPHLNLKCRHRCIGVCGEPCPDVCKICDEEQFLQLYVSLDQFKTKDDTTYIQLDCGHLFKRTELDSWVDARSKEFQLISCPKCNQTIHLNQSRYSNAIKRTYNTIMEIRHVMNNNVETNVKLEAFMRYCTTIINAIKICNLSNRDTLFQGLSYDELKQFDTASDEELRMFAVACHKNTDFKFYQGIKKFIENKKENWISAINVITNMFDSTFSLLKLSSGNLDITSSLEVLLKFTMENHRSLSLQVIQDVTCEQKRLALWIMTDQLKMEILDHSDLQIVRQVENVLIPTELGRFKSLLPQQAKHLYTILSKVAIKYGTRLIDKKYISTPKLPLLYTGRWIQCTEGHYHCIPQELLEVSCDFSISQECPHCTKNDDDFEH